MKWSRICSRSLCREDSMKIFEHDLDLSDLSAVICWVSGSVGNKFYRHSNITTYIKYWLVDTDANIASACIRSRYVFALSFKQLIYITSAVFWPVFLHEINIYIDREQSPGRKEGPPTKHQETKYAHFWLLLTWRHVCINIAYIQLNLSNRNRQRHDVWKLLIA